MIDEKRRLQILNLPAERLRNNILQGNCECFPTRYSIYVHRSSLASNFAPTISKTRVVLRDHLEDQPSKFAKFAIKFANQFIRFYRAIRFLSSIRQCHTIRWFAWRVAAAWARAGARARMHNWSIRYKRSSSTTRFLTGGWGSTNQNLTRAVARRKKFYCSDDLARFLAFMK